MTSAPPSVIATTRFVPLKDLVVDHKLWMNPRTETGLDDDDLLELGKDIKTRGIQDAPKVQKVLTRSGFTNLVIDGQRRVLAATEVLDGDTLIPVIDRTVEPIEFTEEEADKIMLDMLAVVTYREGLNSYELSTVAERLRARGRTLGEISKAIHKDESWVSKMLTARKNASPKLMLRWRKGEITDEQFKDLASVKDPEKQAEAVAEVVKAREQGDSTEARVRAKELAAQFKSEQKGKPDKEPAEAPASKPDPTPKRAVTGEQRGLFEDKPAPKKLVQRTVLEDILAMAKQRPPTSDYVKGVMDACRFVVGDIELDGLGKAWKQYVSRVDGTGGNKKRKPTKAKKAAMKKAARGKKAKRK